MSDNVASDVAVVVISPNSDTVQPSAGKEGDRGKTPRPTGRRIRINNNLVSTIFQIPDPDESTPRPVKRCIYHRDINSHEDLFGQSADHVDHTATVRCRITPTPNTQENLFGGSDLIPRQLSSIRLAASAHEDTFDSLFGLPEPTQNSRRHYEEDTHCKLFGEPDPTVHRQQQGPQEDTQANLFGPPTASTHHVSSRSEDTQFDLFGPPLPQKVSTKKADRSSLQLFTDEELEPLKPIVQTRAEKINGASYEKLFGAPAACPLVPRLPPDEDTALRLFGPTIPKPPPSSEQKFNPITGVERAETTQSASEISSPASPAAPAPPRPASAVFSPITGLTRDGCASQQAEEKISRKRRIQPVSGTKVNTITGAQLNYTPAEGEAATQDVEVEKKGEKKEPTAVAAAGVATESSIQTTVAEKKSLEPRAALQQDSVTGKRSFKKRGKRPSNDLSNFVF